MLPVDLSDSRSESGEQWSDCSPPVQDMEQMSAYNICHRTATYLISMMHVHTLPDCTSIDVQMVRNPFALAEFFYCVIFRCYLTSGYTSFVEYVKSFLGYDIQKASDGSVTISIEYKRQRLL